MRLNRFLAAAGIASRRQADELIAQGRVTVNGRRCNDFHYQPGPGDHVKVDDKLISPKTQVYLALNKPRGFLCTQRDLHVTDTIFDLLPPKFSRLFHVGRLDAQSEGLLLLTNDGDFVQRLTHPRFKIEKEYEVNLDRPASPDLAERLLRGVILDGKRAMAARVRRISATRLQIVLTQGLNRQIRRMLERFGFHAKRLRRIRIANLGLHDLPLGKWRQLSPHEVRRLTIAAASPAKN